MEIFYYVALWGVVLLAGLIPKQTRTRLLSYAGLSFLFTAASVVLYIAVTQWAGIVRFGMATDRKIPQDYLNHGLGGFIAFLVIVMGVLSPLAAMWITGRLKTGRTTQ